MRSLTSGDRVPPSLTRGGGARRALILRRAAGGPSQRVLRTLNAEVRIPAGTAVPTPPGDQPAIPPRPLAPEQALDDDRNRWGGRL